MIEAIRRGFPIASARWPIVYVLLACRRGARAIVRSEPAGTWSGGTYGLSDKPYPCNDEFETGGHLQVLLFVASLLARTYSGSITNAFLFAARNQEGLDKIQHLKFDKNEFPPSVASELSKQSLVFFTPDSSSIAGIPYSDR
jgi:hypothetical protein